MHSTKKPPQREAVLAVIHDDYHIEFFYEKNVNLCVVRCPAAFSNEARIIAEDIVEQQLSPYWRKLYFPGNVRATANTRPLLPSTMARAKQAKADIATLNKWGAA